MVRPQQVSTEKIIDVARECFFEHGLNVSMQVIADKVGLSQPALFKRFKTKKDLIFAALAPPERLPIHEWIEAGPGDEEFRVQLNALITKLWETMQWLLPRLMILKSGRIDPSEFIKRYKTIPLIRLLEELSAWFARAEKRGLVRAGADSATWAQSCLGALHGRAISRHLMQSDFGPDDDAQYIRHLVDLFWRGMQPENSDD